MLADELLKVAKRRPGLREEIFKEIVSKAMKTAETNVQVGLKYVILWHHCPEPELAPLYSACKYHGLEVENRKDLHLLNFGPKLLERAAENEHALLALYSQLEKELPRLLFEHASRGLPYFHVQEYHKTPLLEVLAHRFGLNCVYHDFGASLEWGDSKYSKLAALPESVERGKQLIEKEFSFLPVKLMKMAERGLTGVSICYPILSVQPDLERTYLEKYGLRVESRRSVYFFDWES